MDSLVQIQLADLLYRLPERFLQYVKFAAASTRSIGQRNSGLKMANPYKDKRGYPTRF